MKSLSSVFWILVVVVLFYVGFKVVPIYYKGIFGIRGVCKENADVYHKWGKNYAINDISEKLRRMGIPEDKSDFTIDQTKESVIITISYYDEVTFFESLPIETTKEFEFEYECEGVLKSVY